MADVSEEEVAQLQERIVTLTRRLRLRETQIAGYGMLEVPPHIILDKEQAEHELTQTQAALRRLRPGFTTERTPYVGLLTFQESDAEHFFGRDQLIADLVERLKRAPFLAVLGPSGSGKSSIVRAGLIPMLKNGALAGSDSWRYITITPGTYPLDTLATELTKLQGGDLGNALALSHQLAANDRSLLIAVNLLLNHGARERLVLVIDQCEELWTFAPTDAAARKTWTEQQQQPFIDLLLTAVMAPDTPLLLILTMRADFLHRSAEHPALAHAIAEHDVIISPMTRGELREAVERPAEAMGYGFEPGLVDELIDQTIDRPGALPLLEYTLLELWKARSADHLLTWASFQSVGGVEGGLACRADAILKEGYTSEQQDELRQILLLLVKPGEGTADTRRRMVIADLASSESGIESVYALLAPLINARLLTTGRDDQGRETVDVAHEALIRAWPTLGQWISVARDDLRFQHQLEDAAQEWQRNDQSDDFLWSGVRLARAEEWIVRAKPRLNTRDQAFLVASRVAEQANADAEEATRREREHLLEERTKRLRIFLGVVVILLLITTASIVFTLQARANAAADLLLAQHHATEAIAALADGQVDRAALLARSAILVDQYAELPVISLTVRRVFEAITPEHSLRGHQGWVTALAWSPDGRYILTGSGDGTARIWDAVSGVLYHSLAHSQDPDPDIHRVWAVAWSPNGQQVLTGSWDGTARIWDVATGESRLTLQHNELRDTDVHRVWAVAWSPNGQQVLTGSWDGTTRIWDAAGGAMLQKLVCNPDSKKGRVLSVAWSPDGKHVGAGLINGTVCIWDLTTSHRPMVFQAHATEVRALAWSPDGKHILTCSIDITARIWDATNGQQVRLFVGHEDNVRAAAWSPDGKRIVTGSDDRTARIWDVDTAQEISTLAGHNGAVWAVGWSPDGHQIITGSFDNTARIWIADTQMMVAKLTEHVCLDFTDAEIRTESAAWRGCTTELAAVSQDLKQYDSLNTGK